MLNPLLRFLNLLNSGHFRTQKTRVLDEVDMYLQTSVCMYIYVPERLTHHAPDVVDELRRVGHCLYRR